MNDQSLRIRTDRTYSYALQGNCGLHCFTVPTSVIHVFFCVQEADASLGEVRTQLGEVDELRGRVLRFYCADSEGRGAEGRGAEGRGRDMQKLVDTIAKFSAHLTEALQVRACVCVCERATFVHIGSELGCLPAGPKTVDCKSTFSILVLAVEDLICFAGI